VATLDDAARAAAEGDAEAFGTLVRETSTTLFRLAARICGDADDAKDVLQETYLRAHRALLRSGWDGRARVQTWLYRITCNTALNLRRGRERRRLRDHQAGQSSTEPRQEAAVMIARVIALVSELPHDQRVAIVLKELEGLTSREIAEIQGCSEGAVEQRLVRARITLRRRWGHD
jgi:RNA polymerase sigma-70 factor (ECF subfamily)